MNRDNQQEKSSFEGGAFHPGLDDGRASGTLHVSPSGIRFESPKGRFEVPLEQLHVALGGANDRLVFFTHPTQPEATIHTADHSILTHPELTSRPELRAQIAGVHKRKRTAVVVLLSVVGVLLGAIVGLVLAKDQIVKAVANSIPVSWEIKLGDTLYEQTIKSERIIDDPEIQARLREITEPLVAGIEDAGYPLKFHIVEDPTINAFALPGGNVVIHSALLLNADRPEEVAGVLAHEIAHVTRRHGFRGIISSLGLYAVLQAFIGDVSGVLAVVANNSAFLLDRKFSRDFEREADNTGWEYLIQASIEPRGMIEFFKTLEAEEQKRLEDTPMAGAEKALSIMSTHPATDERMASLERKWERLETKTGFREFALNYSGFKDSLRAKLHSAPDSERN